MAVSCTQPAPRCKRKVRDFIPPPDSDPCGMCVCGAALLLMGLDFQVGEGGPVRMSTPCVCGPSESVPASEFAVETFVRGDCYIPNMHDLTSSIPNAYDPMPHMEVVCLMWGSYASYEGSMPHMGVMCHMWGSYASYGIASYGSPMPHMGVLCLL